MASPSSRLIDLRTSTNHPLSLRYGEVYDAAILDGRLRDGRTQPCLQTDLDTPFVTAARQAVEFGIHKQGAVEVMEASLREFYLSFRPASATQWLGLTKGANALLHSSPPWAAVFPWRARSLASYRKAYEDAAYVENCAVGRNIGISDGWLFCGPVSEDKIRIEAERLLFVLQRISAQGYQRSDDGDGDVKATALVNERLEWVWLTTAGNHRAAAAAALGLESIPVRVNLVISRGDAPLWKHVVEGLYSVDEALTVFDNIFHACPIESVRAWFS